MYQVSFGNNTTRGKKKYGGSWKKYWTLFCQLATTQNHLCVASRIGRNQCNLIVFIVYTSCIPAMGHGVHESMWHSLSTALRLPLLTSAFTSWLTGAFDFLYLLPAVTILNSLTHPLLPLTFLYTKWKNELLGN